MKTELEMMQEPWRYWGKLGTVEAGLLPGVGKLEDGQKEDFSLTNPGPGNMSILRDHI